MFCWHRLALLELLILIKMAPTSYNVMFNIKTYLSASFCGACVALILSVARVV